MSDTAMLSAQGLLVEKCVVVRPTGAFALRALVMDGVNLSLEAFHNGRCVGAARFLATPASYGRRLGAMRGPVVLALLTGVVPELEEGQALELCLKAGQSGQNFTVVPEIEKALTSMSFRRTSRRWRSWRSRRSACPGVRCN